jgi:hypothetical protein
MGKEHHHGAIDKPTSALWPEHAAALLGQATFFAANSSFSFFKVP